MAVEPGQWLDDRQTAGRAVQHALGGTADEPVEPVVMGGAQHYHVKRILFGEKPDHLVGSAGQ
jgi:hypothetical protein